MSGHLRHAGVEVAGAVPWGTHFCQLCQCQQDGLELLVRYFRQGLADNEFCMWVTSGPLGKEEARCALGRAVAGLDEHVQRGQMKFWDAAEWYLCEGQFDTERVLAGWLEMERAALTGGYDGLRIAGDLSWLPKADWKTFSDYEATVHQEVVSHRILALCVYALDRCGAVEVCDIIRNHHFALIRQEGAWEVIQSPQRREIERSLEASEQRYRSLFSGMTEGFAVHEILCDAAGQPCDYRFLDVNPAFERLTGLKRDDLIDRTVRQILPNEDFQWIEIYGKVALTGQPIHFDSHSEALDRHYDVFAYCPAPRQFAVLFTDVTERRLAEQERRRLESHVFHTQKLESVGVMAGGIAHDFNNILAGIMGYTDLATVQLPDTEQARASLTEIKKAARRAADLTRQLLAYSGKGKFLVEPQDLSQIVEENREMLAMSISKKASVRYELASDLPTVQADEAQICQIVMNLIINASESLGEQVGVISVSTGEVECTARDMAGMELGKEINEGLYAYLEVADTGCGMDKPTLAKVFDPFFTTKFTGRGLGLAAVHGIVRGHNGAIRVASQPGQGTTFRVLFPAVRQPTPAERDRPASPGPGGNGTVLVVDDEEIVRSMAEQILAHAGYSVLVASNGMEAMRLYRQRKDDVVCVLLDLTMPHMDGAETFRELRRIRPDVRVILSSGYGEENATERFADMDLAGFIQKPYQLETLIATLRKAIGG